MKEIGIFALEIPDSPASIAKNPKFPDPPEKSILKSSSTNRFSKKENEAAAPPATESSKHKNLKRLFRKQVSINDTVSLDEAADLEVPGTPFKR
ncbi:hypothetical protein PoB_004436200 [Plakobranchus ocellatus]|uniref:Uncharacterized protein n=1 Tax=Plakobranchus ocellatus TaxID=259542 RepID=A0AAV4BEJ2_9GAST|nr:hypothetical protein PoB_004436200 [Plakobranchus ocellatus]